jgi:hypothetical protein
VRGRRREGEEATATAGGAALATTAATTARPDRAGWAPPTRRRFLGLVLAAGAAGAVAPGATRAVREVVGAEQPRKTRWIGHC